LPRAAEAAQAPEAVQARARVARGEGAQDAVVTAVLRAALSW